MSMEHWWHQGRRCHFERAGGVSYRCSEKVMEQECAISEGPRWGTCQPLPRLQLRLQTLSPPTRHHPYGKPHRWAANLTEAWAWCGAQITATAAIAPSPMGNRGANNSVAFMFFSVSNSAAFVFISVSPLLSVICIIHGYGEYQWSICI